MGRIRALMHLLFKTNLFWTLYFNFKFLSFEQAIKIPIYIYGKMNLRENKGKIILDFKNIGTGCIRIGRLEYKRNSTPYTTMLLNGKIIFKGAINIYSNNYIYVNDNGVLEFGSEGTFLGTNNTIICFDNICLGNSVRITWDCQIIDTSFHYIEIDNEHSKLTKRVFIDNNNWIGNRCTIMRGTILPQNNVVGSNSLLNKDYTDFGSFNLIAGIPAKKVKSNVKKIYDIKMEESLDSLYGYKRVRL